MPLTFDISMGVEKGNEALKGRLEAAVRRRQADILTILEEYGVPLPGTNGGGSETTTRNVAQAPAKLNPFTDDADMAAEGRALYFQVGCQGCHGGEGAAGWPPP